MSLTATIPTRHNFTGNDVAESFSYTVKIDNKTHIKLVHTDTDGAENVLADPLVVDVDYTVNGVGDAGGGTVDFPKAGSVYSTLATGEKLSILYDFPIEQTLDLPNVGRLFNESVEDQLDYLTILINQSQEKFDRSIKLVEGSTLTDIAFPEGSSASNRKTQVIAWDDDGTGLTLGASIGTFRGDWATATAYALRDLVKDTDNGNIYYCNTAHTSTGTLPISSNTDVAKWDLLVDAASATASAAAVAYKYTFSNTTSMADPGAGIFRLNNATIGSVTAMAIDATTAASGNPDVSDFIASLDDGTNTTHFGYVTIRKDNTPATFAIYSITGTVTDNTGWLQLTLTHVASNGTWTDADAAHISFSRSGNRGNDAGLDMTFESNTTDTDQGTGKTWLNNATPSSATVLYMDDVDANSANINSLVDSWDDSDSTIKGEIEISKQSDPAVFAIYNITGSVTSASTYSKVAVTYVTGAGSFTDADPVNVTFTRAGRVGDTGATGGGLANVVDDTTPQLGGDLDLNGKNIDFPTTANISDCLDDDTMGTASATTLATSESIKTYVDNNSGGSKNLVINGDMRISQRGTSFATLTASQYTIDRMEWIDTGTTAVVVTITQDTDVPTVVEAGVKFENSLKIDVTTAEDIASGDAALFLSYKIEAQNVTLFGHGASGALSAKLSFWFKSTKTGIFTVNVDRDDATEKYSTEFTVGTTNTWEKHTVTIPGDTNGSAIADNNGIGLTLQFMMAIGATGKTSTKDAWNASGSTELATSNQVNLLDNTSNNVLITGILYEIGSSASAFPSRDFGTELSLCERYYQKSYNVDVDPATVTAVGRCRFNINGFNSSVYTANIMVNFTTRMRTTPTIVSYDDAGASGKATTDVNGRTATTLHAGNHQFVNNTDSSGASTTRNISFHYTASAEL